MDSVDSLLRAPSIIGIARSASTISTPRHTATLSATSALSAEPDLRPAWGRARPLDARQLGGWYRLRLAEHVFASQTLFADDTPIPVLDPGRGRTKTGRLWVYVRDEDPIHRRPSTLQPGSPFRAASGPSGAVQGSGASRRVCRVRAAMRRRPDPAGGVLGACAAQVL